ncbi:hypothetical protein [Pyrobaculum neutrophilum]|uniref:Uncharacterized protein n=1 Tax=Pyrobaculum neutrophilum (strain DSM 2338 / JCM 9278 / NBRC 100436 / V24Sta) TaxID=444157 RepID=B1YAE1_PYRNV|nr:hypothetical protein [Pyrobaculum neutrophilum]ACB40590.1 conserved hypothetical protein [Pyrobaculum neutrophilum V24Sta]
MSVFEVLSTVFVIRGRDFECATSIGDYHVAVTEQGAVYAMRCREGGECRDCVEFPIYEDVVAYLPRRFYNCLGCLLGEFFNAGLFNISVGGVVVTQRRAYLVPPMAKERGDPERLAKRAGGILENYMLKVLAASFKTCCKL